MKPPSKCPLCSKKLSVRRVSSGGNKQFYTCYRDNLRTEDIIVHFECVISGSPDKENEVVELYVEIGDYYVCIAYDCNPEDTNFFLYKIVRESESSTQESLHLITKMSGFFPEIDFDDIDSLLKKIETWQTFS